MTGADPYGSEMLGYLEVDATNVRDLSPPASAAAPAG
jgi:hypothetical protein